MKKLSENWFIEGIIDLEYQQYILLDYLQSAKKYYTEFRLYPYLSDLIKHHQNLLKFQEDKNRIFDSFPKRITGINLLEKKLEYESTENDTLKTISEIIEFSLPQIKNHIEIGQALYDAIEKQIKIEPIGIQALYKKEGYLIIDTENNMKVFEFKISSFEIDEEKYSGINFTHLSDFDSLSLNPGENIKLKILERNKSIPNACSYYVKICREFSNVLEESIIPIIKRKIVIMQNEEVMPILKPL